MAKEVKFTEKELQSLADLQTKYSQVTNRFGQLTIAKINLEKQQEALEEEEFKLNEELESVRKEEQETLQKINDKYGPGSLNPETGTFTPSIEVGTPSTEE